MAISTMSYSCGRPVRMTGKAAKPKARPSATPLGSQVTRMDVGILDARLYALGQRVLIIGSGSNSGSPADQAVVLRQHKGRFRMTKAPKLSALASQYNLYPGAGQVPFTARGKVQTMCWSTEHEKPSG